MRIQQCLQSVDRLCVEVENPLIRIHDGIGSSNASHSRSLVILKHPVINDEGQRFIRCEVSISLKLRIDISVKCKSTEEGRLGRCVDARIVTE